MAEKTTNINDVKLPKELLDKLESDMKMLSTAKTLTDMMEKSGTDVSQYRKKLQALEEISVIIKNNFT